MSEILILLLTYYVCTLYELSLPSTIDFIDSLVIGGMDTIEQNRIIDTLLDGSMVQVENLLESYGIRNYEEIQSDEAVEEDPDWVPQEGQEVIFPEE